ncbi:heavy-metal-associated domain-containing protein [Paenarthrobacter nicotinovorans]|uniref:heavy-metal-associated domain-containing protein n=1 Tax=Paenarthrobacter nicotinovorans TaxID=29320 RepID=UPI0037FE7892
MQTPSRTELPLTSTSSPGCACCSTSRTLTDPSTVAGVEYAVEGLTCGGCVSKVERALATVDGVDSATVELIPGGVSRLLVTGTAESDTITAAVAAAGYGITNH